jgi:hypothetical protein
VDGELQHPVACVGRSSPSVAGRSRGVVAQRPGQVWAPPPAAAGAEEVSAALGHARAAISPAI